MAGVTKEKLKRQLAGFRWACPRFGPGGFDVGLAIWNKWTSASLSQGQALQYVVLDNQSDSALSLAHFHQAARAFLFEFMGLQDSSLFTSYSLRRSMPHRTKQKLWETGNKPKIVP